MNVNDLHKNKQSAENQARNKFFIFFQLYKLLRPSFALENEANAGHASSEFFKKISGASSKT